MHLEASWALELKIRKDTTTPRHSNTCVHQAWVSSLSIYNPRTGLGASVFKTNAQNDMATSTTKVRLGGFCARLLAILANLGHT